MIKLDITNIFFLKDVLYETGNESNAQCKKNVRFNVSHYVVPYACGQVIRVVTHNLLLNSCFWRSYHLIKLRVASPNIKFKSFGLRSSLSAVFYTILLLWQIMGTIYNTECIHRFSSPSNTNFDLFDIQKPYCRHTMAQNKIKIGELCDVTFLF